MFEEKERLFASVPLVNIDHHYSNSQFGRFNFVDADASSTAEVLFDFLNRMNAPIIPQIANLLLTGIITDTK